MDPEIKKKIIARQKKGKGKEKNTTPSNSSTIGNIDDSKKIVLDFCDELYNSVRTPEFTKEPPKERYEFIMGKYQQFCQAYPVISKYMVVHLKYNRKAMSCFLDKLQKNSGGGMEKFCELQADYAKYLYIEEEKAMGRHPDMTKANKIKKYEYDEMYKFIKDMKTLEKNETASFEKEQNELLDTKRQELLSFLDDVDPAEHETTSIDSLSMAELMGVYHRLRDYEIKLLEILDEKNNIIDRCTKGKEWIPPNVLKHV